MKFWKKIVGDKNKILSIMLPLEKKWLKLITSVYGNTEKWDCDIRCDYVRFYTVLF